MNGYEQELRDDLARCADLRRRHMEICDGCGDEYEEGRHCRNKDCAMICNTCDGQLALLHDSKDVAYCIVCTELHQWDGKEWQPKVITAAQYRLGVGYDPFKALVALAEPDEPDFTIPAEEIDEQMIVRCALGE